ncbi:MAG: TonB-dependent receptor [Azospirillaceae bacterium]|nr:TonB-dependent receptor [Azospirillaceae bacterium]
MLRELKQRCLLGAAAVAMLAGGSAYAQTTQAPAPANPNDAPVQGPAADELEPIIVTAEKRQVDLQHAPISVTAVSADTLEKGNVTGPLGLNGYVPGLQINPSGGSEVMVSIRGVGSQTPENFFTQPGVSFHIDNVYIPNNIALNLGFLDVDHVEVLRGPQGTVFGQSSTGGAINVISKQPQLGKLSGDATATFGNYSYAMGKADLNVPIGDTAAIRAVVQKTSHDGYATATGIPGGYDLDDANNVNYKLAGLWQPTDNLSITLTGQHFEDDHHGSALKSIDDPNPDPREVTQDFPAKFKLSMDVDTLNINYSLPFGNLKSISSYQYMDAKQSFDSDRSTEALFGGYDTVAAWNTKSRAIMEEVTLSSNPGTDLDWIAGVFYMHSHSSQYVVEYKGTDTSDPTPVLPTSTSASAIPANLSYENLSSVDRDSVAPFLQGTYHLTDRWRLTGGVRYNVDLYNGWGSDYYGAPSPRTTQVYALTGKAETDFDLTSDNMIYASWSRGYKPGGINTGTNSAEVVSNTYSKETVDSFEVGSKNRFLNNHLNVNVSAFYSKYNNMQYIEEDPVPYSGGIGNIPQVNMWGAEIEAKYRLLDNRLELGGNLTLMDGEIPDSYLALDRRLADAAAAKAVAAGVTYPYSAQWFAIRAAQSINVKGNTPPDMPGAAGGVNASWLQTLGNYGSLTSRIELLFRSDYEARVFNESVDHVPSYSQINLFFEYLPESGPWRATFTVTNLLDRSGIAGRYTDPYGSGVVSNQYIPPRQMLASVSYSF